MHQLLKLKQTVVTETSKSSCKVIDFLGGGGQGEVYLADLGGTSVALKWYFPHTATDEQRKVLEDLVRQGPPDDRFLWPQEMTSASGTKGYGYVMPLRPKRFQGINDLMAGRAKPSFDSLTTAGYQLSDSYYQLHAKGLCYRDISFGNVFFDGNTGEVLICDNDNVAVDRQATSNVLGTPRFMAPEIVCGDAMPSRDTDLYSLAVLLFYLFVVHHPLEGEAETAIRCFNPVAMNKIYGNGAVFIFDPNNDSNRPDPEHHQNAIDLWPFYPEKLRSLFMRSFTEGIRDPNHGRVKENEWRSAMIELRDSITHCPHCQAENFYDTASIKAAGGKPGDCYWCEKPLEMPFRMRVTGQKTVVVLTSGKQLFAHHLMHDKPFDFSQPLAEVTQHPKDPTVMGLKNLTQQKWVMTATEGEMKDVEPGRNVRVAEGNKINFGGVEGEFRL